MSWDLTWLRELAQSTPWPLAWLVMAGLFTALYGGFAGATLLLTRRVLPHWKIGATIDPRPLAHGQVAHEMRWSLLSIAIFAAYGVVTLLLDRAGVIAVRWHDTPWSALRDLGLFFLWNELHFYCCHRLLHTRWLLRTVHAVHHRSVVPTPFSTYSFHGVEALLLSSVMLLWLLVLPLGITTVILFPAVSLVLNCIGHMNYALFPRANLEDLLAGSSRHTWHHTHGGNFGFYLSWLDGLFGTRKR
jgi:lathosterol oxidase